MDPSSKMSSAFSRRIRVPLAKELLILRDSAAVFCKRDWAPFLKPRSTRPSFLYSSRGSRIKSAIPVPMLSTDRTPEMPEAMLGICVL